MSTFGGLTLCKVFYIEPSLHFIATANAACCTGEQHCGIDGLPLLHLSNCPMIELLA
jgi:hypothetical protein